VIELRTTVNVKSVSLLNKDKMKKNEKTIYLIEFALEVIKDNGLEKTKNSDNWTIGEDLEEHLKLLKQDIVLHSVEVCEYCKVKKVSQKGAICRSCYYHTDKC
jgi:hypothetical protein